MSFAYSDHALIPLATGQAVTRGWHPAHGRRPLGVTWHWTVTRDLATCRRVLGGDNAERKGQASAHYGVGRSFAEGVDRYVTLENRSWHAGVEQRYRWDGRALSGPNDKGSRTTIGVETVNIGHATATFPAAPDWIHAASPLGRRMRVQPWTDEQVAMMIAVGREIVARWPHIAPRDHHGHHDLCPTYKVDVTGFPFARVLRGIYDDASIADVWAPLWLPRQRQRALLALGASLAPYGADGEWGQISDLALRRFQREQGMPADGVWTTFTCWRVHDLLAAQGTALDEVTGHG